GILELGVRILITRRVLPSTAAEPWRVCHKEKRVRKILPCREDAREARLRCDVSPRRAMPRVLFQLTAVRSPDKALFVSAQEHAPTSVPHSVADSQCHVF